MGQTPAGDGLWGWLGRQVGYVRAAVKADVTKPIQAGSPGAAEQGAGAEQVIYREEKVEETPHPQDPAVTLRRTVVDEAVVRPPPTADGDPRDRG